jgi:hypothetical protein
VSSDQNGDKSVICAAGVGSQAVYDEPRTAINSNLPAGTPNLINRSHLILVIWVTRCKLPNVAIAA